MTAPASLYRRHRPRTFADVVGQEHVVRTLSNAVSGGNVHHAYLFVGSRGTGKTSMAKILASCLNCVNGPTVTPCGECDSCVSIASATSLDVIEMDAASNNSVDDVRELREKVAYAPVSGRHKVYILDEAHMLTAQAWNAFLKTLEEPPPRTVFVLATTEAQKVLPTVVDRCHRFDFGRPTVGQVAEVLRRVAAAESIAIEDQAVALLARSASGSFRDALGTLEQLVTYAGAREIAAADVLAVLGVAGGEELAGAVDAIRRRDAAAAMRAAARLAAAGRDPGQVLRDLEAHGRELLAVKVLGEVPLELRTTADADARLLEQAQGLSAADCTRLLDLIAAALRASSDGAQPRIQLELVLVKAASPETDPTVAAMLSRIEQLERSLSAAAGAVTYAPAAGSAADAAAQADAPVAQEAAPAAAPAAAPPAPREPEATAVEQPAVAAAPPTPAPTPAPAPVSTAFDLAQGVAIWPAVVELMRAENQMVAAALAPAQPVAASASELVVAFPSGAEFYKRTAEKDDYRRATVGALQQVSGRALALRYELRDADELAAAAGPATSELSDDDLVQRLREEFDAEELLDDELDGDTNQSNGDPS